MTGCFAAMKKAVTAIIMISALTCLLSTAPRAALSGGISISGSGEVVRADLDIFDVILPTAGSLDFLLDPQGLLTVGPGQSAPAYALIGGRIIHTSDARIINNSSTSVKVSVEIWVESTNGGYDGGAVASFIEYTVDDETSIAAVEANENTDHNILLYVAPSTENLATQEDPFIPANTGFIITTNPRTLEFILPGALFDVTQDEDGELISTIIPGTGSGIGLQFGGYVNTNASWLDFIAQHDPSTITVYATFTLTKADSDTVERVEGIPAMIPLGTEDALTLDAGGIESSVDE